MLWSIIMTKKDKILYWIEQYAHSRMWEAKDLQMGYVETAKESAKRAEEYLEKISNILDKYND